MKVTAANVSNMAMMPELLTGEEEVVYGDSCYLGAEKRADAILKNKQGKKIRYKINRRPSVLRVYRAFEGDLRVITREPGKPFEVRYTIRWDGDTPRPEPIP